MFCLRSNLCSSPASTPTPTPSPSPASAPSVTLSTLLAAAFPGLSSRSDNVHVAFLFLPLPHLLVVFLVLFFLFFFFLLFCNLLSKPKLRGSAAFRVIKKCGQPLPSCLPACLPAARACGLRYAHLGTRFTSQLCQMRAWRRQEQEAGVGGGQQEQKQPGQPSRCFCCGPFLLMLAL